MHTGLILVRGLLCGKIKLNFFFFDALYLGQIVLKKIDSKLTQSLDILILYFFYEYLFDIYTLGPFFGLPSSNSLKDLDNTKYSFIVSCSVKSRIQNVTLWKGLESVCNVIVMVVGWLRGNYYIVQRVQDPR